MMPVKLHFIFLKIKVSNMHYNIKISIKYSIRMNKFVTPILVCVTNNAAS